MSEWLRSDADDLDDGEGGGQRQDNGNFSRDPGGAANLRGYATRRARHRRLGLTVVLALVFANAFFVAAEFAIVSSRKTRLEEMARDGDRKARLALRGVQSLDRVISATQLGITLASLGLGWVGEPACRRDL